MLSRLHTLKILGALILTLGVLQSTAQRRISPTGFPSPYSTNWYRVGWIQGDSGAIDAVRDTTLGASMSGVRFLWLHAGVDSSEWFFNGGAYIKLLNTRDTLPGRFLVTPSFLNGQGFIKNITGLFTTGTGYTLNGSGTPGSPYSLTITGGGSVDSAVNAGLFLKQIISGTTKTVFVDTSFGTGLSGYYLRRVDTNVFVTPTQLATGLSSKQGTITLGSTAQYFRGDLSLATFPTNLSSFTNGPGYITANQSITFNASGDVNGTYTNPTALSPTLTINANAVTYSKFQQAAGQGLLGAQSAGNYQLITLGTGLIMSGGVLSATGSGTSTGVDTIWRTPGKDSIQFTIGGRYHSILDSAGGGGGGAVSSVTNSDGTITFSPNTGAIVGSLALGHANTWTGAITANGGLALGSAVTFAADNTYSIGTSSVGANSIWSHVFGSDGVLTLASAASNPINFNVGSGLTKMIIQSTGQIQFSSYTTSTSFTGSGLAVLETDGSGNVVQVPVGSFGGISGGGGLSPLFTNGVSGNTLTFTASTAAGNSILGNSSGTTGAYSFFIPNATLLNTWFSGPIQGAIALTTLGSTGASTFIGNTLNIPQYAGGTSYTFAQSLVNTSGTVALKGDLTTPGRGFFYGARPWLDSAKSFYELEENFYGTIYGANYWTSATTGFVNNGTTVTVSGSNKLAFTEATLGSFSKNLSIAYPSMLDKWQMSGVFTLPAKGVNTYGPGLGKYSINTYAAYNTVARFDGSTDANSGTIIITVGSSNTQVAQSSFALSFSAGDSIILTVSRDAYTVNASARDLTTNSAPIYVSYVFSTAPSSTLFLDNTGEYSVFNFGGSFTLDSLAVTSTQAKNARFAILGDSKSQGYQVTTQNNRLCDLLNQNMRSTITLSGGSDRSVELSERTAEVIALRPQQALLAIGSNDLRDFGPSDSTVLNARFDSIYTALTVAGIDVYATVMYESSIDMTPLLRHVLATYPTKYIDLWTPLQASGALAAGNVHPNNYGDSIMYNSILSYPKIYAKNFRYGGSSSGGGTFSGSANTLSMFNGTGGLSNSPIVYNGSTTITIPVNTVVGATGLAGTVALDIKGETNQHSQFYSFSGTMYDLAINDARTAGIPYAIAGSPLEFGVDAGGTYVEKFRLAATSGNLLYGTTTDDGVHVFQVYGSTYWNDSAAIHTRFSYDRNLGSTFTLHTLVDKNYVDSSIAGHSGGSQTFQQTLTTGSTLTGANSIVNTGFVFTWTNGGTGVWKWSGNSQDSTNTVGVSVVANDSSQRMIPWAKFATKLSQYLPTFNIFAANGLTAAAGDSIYLGGTLNQPTTINISGTNLLTFGLASSGVIVRTNGTQNFSESINLSKSWNIGYTKTAGVFALGSGIVVDTLNDVILGNGTALTGSNFAALNSSLSNSVAFASYMVTGAHFQAITSVNSNTTISLGSGNLHTILVNATSGNITITLPAASGGFVSAYGIEYIIQKTDASANTVTIAGAGSDLVNGSSTQVITTQYQARHVQAASSSTWAMY